jgi:hypothetical protein
MLPGVAAGNARRNVMPKITRAGFSFAGQPDLVASFDIVKDREGEKRGQRVRIVFKDPDEERRFMAALEREG